MGLQTKAIKQKIKSVKNIGKITKTMEMVSVSKMKKTTERVVSGRSYSKYALELLHNIATERHVTHPLLEKRDSGKVLVVVISSNKGLAGSYNLNIVKALSSYKNLREGKQIDCLTIGKQSEKAARVNGLNIIASFHNFSEKSTSEDFLAVRDVVLKEFTENGYEAVKVIFTEFKSATSYKPFIMQLLPVKEGIYKDILLQNQNGETSTEKKFSMYLFEPSESEVLDSVIRQLLEQALFNMFLEAQASEHSARMFAMKNANDNASEMMDSLTLLYNQVRQGAITQEISEIVGGAAAMN